jgi:hypothetical protein
MVYSSSHSSYGKIFQQSSFWNKGEICIINSIVSFVSDAHISEIVALPLLRHLEASGIKLKSVLLVLG